MNGVVINNHINNNNGEDLILIFIFKEGFDIENFKPEGIKKSDLLLEPIIVGKEYWTKGFFNKISRCEKIIINGIYGFYSVGKGFFCDEYGKEIKSEPDILGTYGVASIYGVAMEIAKELIILG